jgi:TRAP-type C4-dicarboxylate transport system substrate-binding protein
MKKKQLQFLKVMAICLVILLQVVLVGCNKSEQTDPDKDEPYTLVFSSAYPKNDDPRDGRNVMLRLLEERSNGRIKIVDYWGGSLVDQIGVLDALAEGTIDIADAQPDHHVDQIPSVECLSLPFFSNSPEEGYRILKETEVGEIIKKEYEDYGVVLFAFESSGDLNFFTKKPVNKVADFNGMKFRAMSGAMNKWYEELGITGINVSFMELYDAMQRGILDGYPTNTQASNLSSLYEVAKYIIMPAYQQPGWSGKFISKKALEKLPEDLQQVVMDVGKELEEIQLQTMKEVIADELEFALENGMEVITLSAEEQNKYRESAQVLWDDYAKKSEDNARIVRILRGEN